MLEKLEKCFFIYEKEYETVDEDKIIFHDERIEFQYRIPYYINVFLIDLETFRKSFIFDLRNMEDEQLNAIFNNYQYFQEEFCSNQYFRDYSPYLFNFKNNMEIIFLYDDNSKIRNQYDIMYDMNYMLKKFMTMDELKQYLEKNFSSARFANIQRVVVDDKTYGLTRFNYLYGLNGSGKTAFVNKIANKLKVPVFNANQHDLDLINYIKRKECIKQYLYSLTGSYDVGNYSNYEKYVHRLSQILEFTREHGNILLLDDLNWASLDNLSTIRLIDTLFEFAINNENVLVTGALDDVKSLVKARTYNSNIIEL